MSDNLQELMEENDKQIASELGRLVENALKLSKEAIEFNELKERVERIEDKVDRMLSHFGIDPRWV